MLPYNYYGMKRLLGFDWAYRKISIILSTIRLIMEEHSNEIAPVPMMVGHEELTSIMEGEAKKRMLITRYISQHMKDGTDYGTINFGGRKSKPSLFKPGSEKFLSLFKLIARFEKDSDTWEMAGSEPGTFAYRCTLVASNGAVVGEGRGISKLSEKPGWTINNTVKIAEKRAQIDAVLRTGALSDFFTQDLEDMVKETYDTSPIPENVKIEVHGTDDDMPPIPESISEQKVVIMSLLKNRGVDTRTKKEIERYVADETQLALVPSNYKEIIRLLTVQPTIY